MLLSHTQKARFQLTSRESLSYYNPQRVYRLVGPRVNVLSHHFLPGSRFACDENRDVVHGIAICEVQDFVKLRSFADHQWYFDRMGRFYITRKVASMTEQVTKRTGMFWMITNSCYLQWRSTYPI